MTSQNISLEWVSFLIESRLLLLMGHRPRYPSPPPYTPNKIFGIFFLKNIYNMFIKLTIILQYIHF